MCISPLHVASTHAHGRLPSTHAAAERPAGAGATLMAPWMHRRYAHIYRAACCAALPPPTVKSRNHSRPPTVVRAEHSAAIVATNAAAPSSE
jgi:hypothetical protein